MNVRVCVNCKLCDDCFGFDLVCNYHQESSKFLMRCVFCKCQFFRETEYAVIQILCLNFFLFVLRSVRLRFWVIHKSLFFLNVTGVLDIAMLQ